MAGAKFGAQANALLRKSIVYQRRNVSTNVCLLSAPIGFCLILLGIRVSVNMFFLSGDEYKCGCQCTQCCYGGDPSNCSSLEAGYCDTGLGYSCKATNSSNCGIRYSSADQAGFCQVLTPSVWPPVVQVPEPQRLARPWAPAGAMLTTGTGTGAYNVTQMDGQYLDLPFLDRQGLLALLAGLVSEDGLSVNGQLLTLAGFTFGSASEPGRSQYLETAFIGSDPLLWLVPTESGRDCASFGMAPPNATTLPLLELLLLVTQQTSGDVVTMDDISMMTSGTPPGSGSQSAGGNSWSAAVQGTALGQPTTCTDVDSVIAPDLSAMNSQIYCGYWQARCNGTAVTNEYMQGVEYDAAGRGALDMAVHYNGTQDNAADAGFSAGPGPSNYYRVQRVLSGAIQAWWVATVGQASALADDVQVLGIQAMPKSATKLKLDFSTILGPLFYSWVVSLLLPTFLQQLVYEKEKRLRLMMKMHGLGDGAYWLVTYLWYLSLYMLYMIIFMLFGALVGLEVFRRTSAGVQIIFYFLYGNTMIAFAFVLSSLFTSSRTATVVAFMYVFAAGLIAEMLLKIFMENGDSWVFFLEWVPSFALYRGLWEMAEYAFLGVYRNDRGLTFARLSDDGCGMLATWGIFLVEWPIFMLLAWYLEQVLSNGNGVRRHPLFFLECCWGRCRRRGRAKDDAFKEQDATLELSTAPGKPDGANAAAAVAEAGPEVGIVVATVAATLASPPMESMISMALRERGDVRAEEIRVETLEEPGALPIVVQNLRKVYPPLDGGKPKVAVRSLTLGVERGECFGLLGPNGAGKTTALHMLTGILEPSEGHAWVEGLDITQEMPAIYGLMGVCPQHDLLWEQLTAEEHLLFYGRLKGLKGPELAASVRSGLEAVNLWANKLGHKQAGKFSGGMKRRLSVAISLVGEPKVVYMDEPSTGLDPASRRSLWDVVRRSKQGRAIILTTHSMEEAETLCDRLGIFVDGQLVCIGNPKQITSRYAGYLLLSLCVAPGHEAGVASLVASLSPRAKRTYALGTTFKYELPTADTSLGAVFDAVGAARAAGLVVLDWGVSNATLEEVFIKLAREAGAKSHD